ncbi:MAG TPA: MGMT family protein [Rhodanobacteraceae bacterium]|nr:MGMT family protein [Rhodanobacteraceae bacterium]
MKSVDRKSPRNTPVIDHAKILRVIRSIPRGVVVAYGEIAERAGCRGRARLIGRVLAESPTEDLPWHRVLRADGRIAFPPGSRSFREQVRRLAAEGILVVRGRVKLDAHGWDRNLDAALWAPPSGGAARPKRGK